MNKTLPGAITGLERAEGSSPVMGVTVSDSTPAALGLTQGQLSLIRAAVSRGRLDQWYGSSVRGGGPDE